MNNNANEIKKKKTFIDLQRQKTYFFRLFAYSESDCPSSDIQIT